MLFNFRRNAPAPQPDPQSGEAPPATANLPANIPTRDRALPGRVNDLAFGDRWLAAMAALKGDYDTPRQILEDRRKSAIEEQRRDWRSRATAAMGEVAPPLGDVAGRPGNIPLRKDVTPLLFEGAGLGEDVTPFVKLMDLARTRRAEDQFLETLPPPLRPGAALDPAGYAAWDRDVSKPGFYSVGGNIVSVDPRKREATSIWTAPREPEPVTSDRVLGSALAKLASGAELTVGEQQLVDRYISGSPAADDEPTPNRILGLIQDKIARGVPLSPGEQQLYDDSKLSRLDPLTAMMFGGGPAPISAPRASASDAGSPPPSPTGKVEVKGGVYYPRSARDMSQVPKGARFVNPATGETLVKAR